MKDASSEVHERSSMTERERIRWAIYAAILAALETGHPRRVAVARALDEVADRYRDSFVVSIVSNGGGL